ncbi:uncharacterized protein A1O9_09394, partial [Exophiala aquamarina CBS 119918]
HDIIVTVRSNAKGNFVVETFQSLGTLSFVIIEYNIPESVQRGWTSSPSFKAVINSASPFYTNTIDPWWDLLDPDHRNNQWSLYRQVICAVSLS